MLKRLSVALEKTSTMIINCEQDYPFGMELWTKSDTWLHTSCDNSKKTTFAGTRITSCCIIVGVCSFRFLFSFFIALLPVVLYYEPNFFPIWWNTGSRVLECLLKDLNISLYLLFRPTTTLFKMWHDYNMTPSNGTSLWPITRKNPPFPDHWLKPCSDHVFPWLLLNEFVGKKIDENVSSAGSMWNIYMGVHMISMDGSFFSVIISPSKKTNWCQVPNKEEKEAIPACLTSYSSLHFTYGEV